MGHLIKAVACRDGAYPYRLEKNVVSRISQGETSTHWAGDFNSTKRTPLKPASSLTDLNIIKNLYSMQWARDFRSKRWLRQPGGIMETGAKAL
jgi:hypothetical protein